MAIIWPPCQMDPFEEKKHICINKSITSIQCTLLQYALQAENETVILISVYYFKRWLNTLKISWKYFQGAAIFFCQCIYKNISAHQGYAEKSTLFLWSNQTSIFFFFFFRSSPSLGYSSYFVGENIKSGIEIFKVMLRYFGWLLCT